MEELHFTNLRVQHDYDRMEIYYSIHEDKLHRLGESEDPDLAPVIVIESS